MFAFQQDEAVIWVGSYLSLPRRGVWLMQCRGPLYVLCTMWMGYPDQTGKLQGHLRVGAGASAENELGTTGPVGLMDKASASGAGDSRFESWAGHAITREPAHAGNKASRTEHYLQW